MYSLNICIRIYDQNINNMFHERKMIYNYNFQEQHISKNASFGDKNQHIGAVQQQLTFTVLQNISKG